MLATCRKLFEIIFHGSYMRIIPRHASGHVRDTCMKCLAIIAFGAFQFIVPKYYYRFGKMEFEESSLLI